MTDLRALLGDRYDEVLTKATKRALFNYPNLPISIVEHEALAAQALAAVLPDLLAEANTRAEDAEAKARRFANLLGSNAKALNNVLPREVLRQKAEAWDEGHRTPWKRGPSGCDCFAQSVVECGCGRYGTGPLITPNPYRTEANRG